MKEIRKNWKLISVILASAALIVINNYKCNDDTKESISINNTPVITPTVTTVINEPERQTQQIAKEQPQERIITNPKTTQVEPEEEKTKETSIQVSGDNNGVISTGKDAHITFNKYDNNHPPRSITVEDVNSIKDFFGKTNEEIDVFYCNSDKECIAYAMQVCTYLRHNGYNITRSEYGMTPQRGTGKFTMSHEPKRIMIYPLSQTDL